MKRLFLAQPEDWFFFNKDAEVFIVVSLLSEGSDDFASRVTGKASVIDGVLSNDFGKTQEYSLQNIFGLRIEKRVESDTIALSKLKDLYREILRRS